MQILSLGRAVGLVLMVSGLTGCDGGASAVAVRDASIPQERAESGEAGASRQAEAYGQAAYGPEAVRSAARDTDAESTPLLEGKPLWSSNSRRSGQDNVQIQFDRNGADFDTDTVQAYARKAHAFVRNPPSGAETLKRRNGDLLIYDPASNVFAVVTDEGAPRTMFKPRDGRAYWEQQKASLSDQARRTGDTEGRG